MCVRPSSRTKLKLACGCARDVAAVLPSFKVIQNRPATFTELYLPGGAGAGVSYGSVGGQNPHPPSSIHPCMHPPTLPPGAALRTPLDPGAGLSWVQTPDSEAVM